MTAQNLKQELEQRKNEASQFLIDTRKLPPEMWWKIQGMLEAMELIRLTAQKQLR